MGRIGKAIRDVVIILGITLALLGVLELGIRWYAGPVAYQSDDEVIATLKPNVEKVFVRSVDGGPQYIHWRTNADGFRGPELLDDPSLRVIVYGDSNIQGRFSVLEDTFVGQLQRLLRGALDENVEVINAGICGYGPDQSLLRFQRELDDYRPDVVVLHIFADNDFGDLIRNRLFDMDENGELVRTSHPFTEDLLLRPDWWNGSVRETIKNLKLSMWPGEIVRGMVRSRVPDQPLVHDPEAFRERSLERIEAEFEVYAKGEPRSVSWLADDYDADIALAPDSQSAQAKMALMAATLKSAAQTAADASVRLVVLIQPASQDITTNLPNHREQLARFPEYDPRRMTQFLVDTCEAAGIENIDLYETFTEVEDPGSLYFRIDDNHWNDAGQLLAAKVTAERLLDDLAEPPGSSADR